MAAKKKLIVHLGYHKTGSSSIQKWLFEHKELLAPQLLCYNLVEGTTNPLKSAVHRWILGKASEADIRKECNIIKSEISIASQNTVCFTDESLLGLPLGFRLGDFVEKDIYPLTRDVIRILSDEFKDFETTFVVFERENEAWLKSVHNQMHKQGCYEGDFAEYMSDFNPQLEWSNLRDEIEAGLSGSAKLVAVKFDEEFKKPGVSSMEFFKLLELPSELMQKARPTLEKINPSVPIQKKDQEKAEAPNTSASPLPAVTKKRMVICGGSNSIILNGWVNLLRREFSELAEVKNLSMGASTSAMALYRFLSEATDPSMPLVWEYALNEYNHFDEGQSLDSLIYHVEWVIQLCIKQNRRLFPIVMQNKRQVSAPGRDTYLTKLTELFESYGLITLDLEQLLNVVSRGHRNFDRLYQDDAHVNTASEVPRRMAEAVLMQIDHAKVPTQRADREAHFTSRELLLAGCATDCRTFENSLVTCTFSDFKANPEFELQGTALAAIIMTSASAPVVEVSVGGTVFDSFSTRVAAGGRAPDRQLRQLVFNAGTDTVGLEMSGKPLKFKMLNEKSKCTIQNMFVDPALPENAPDKNFENGVIGILYERTV